MSSTMPGVGGAAVQRAWAAGARLKNPSQT